MLIRRWDPFNELRRMQENMDHRSTVAGGKAQPRFAPS